MSLGHHARAAPRPLGEALHGWLTLARISNSPTVISNVLAGAALAGVLQPDAKVGLLVLAMVLFYTAGMVLNDVCDYRWDQQHRPTRPLPAGIVPGTAAAGAVLLLMGAGSALLWLIGPAAFLSGLALIALIVFYDAWHKSNPLSPVVMAACRVMVYVTAFVAFGGQSIQSLVIASVLLVLYMAGLTYLAKTETRPTVAGYWPALILFAGPAYYSVATGSPTLAALAAAVAVWIALSIRFVYRTEGRNIGTAIARLIAGISLFDGLVLVSSGALAAIALAVAAFGLTLFFQRYVEGT